MQVSSQKMIKDRRARPRPNNISDVVEPLAKYVAEATNDFQFIFRDDGWREYIIPEKIHSAIVKDQRIIPYVMIRLECADCLVPKSYERSPKMLIREHDFSVVV